VVAAVNFGREHRIEIAVRCGGHNGPGLGSVDDGLVIDLRGLNSVTVDPDARIATVGGGALLAEVDAATHEHGLATPGGIISTTGVGGLILGGGIGHLTRKAGLSIDNVLGAEVVLADGSVVTADEETNPDLYWAIRGGGGNFGVVTELKLRLHPISNGRRGPMFWDLEHAADLLRWYRDFILQAPEDLNGFFAFMSVPPAAAFPGGAAPAKGRGDRLVLDGSEEGAADALAEARERPGSSSTASSRCRSGAAERVRRYLPARRSVVLAGRVRRADPRRGGRAARRRSRGRCRPGIDDAPLPDRRRGPASRSHRHAVGLPPRELGDGDRGRRPGSRKRRDPRTGPSATGMPSTRTPPAART
jgi:FAD/FMN-containing dehydrogenase